MTASELDFVFNFTYVTFFTENMAFKWLLGSKFRPNLYPYMQVKYCMSEAADVYVRIQTRVYICFVYINQLGLIRIRLTRLCSWGADSPPRTERVNSAAPGRRLPRSRHSRTSCTTQGFVPSCRHALNHSASTLQSFCNQSAITLQSISNHSAIILQSLSAWCVIAEWL